MNRGLNTPHVSEEIFDLPADGNSQNHFARFFFDDERKKRILKWEHYLEIYDRHLKRFVGQAVQILEIGVFGGGSLEMWLDYFGSKCHVHGVDIDPRCLVFQSTRMSVHIGDQEDRTFWEGFKNEVPKLDILIDDGGHSPEQQMVTLEEMLPHLMPGGVYICEDIHGINNDFAAFASALTNNLNSMQGAGQFPQQNQNGSVVVKSSPGQASIHSIHFYPFMMVIEKRSTILAELLLTIKGSQALRD